MWNLDYTWRGKGKAIENEICSTLRSSRIEENKVTGSVAGRLEPAHACKDTHAPYTYWICSLVITQKGVIGPRVQHSVLDGLEGKKQIALRNGITSNSPSTVEPTDALDSLW
jgi:hypothetical protein